MVVFFILKLMYQFFYFSDLKLSSNPVLNISRKAIRNPFVNDSLIYKEFVGQFLAHNWH